MAEHRTGTANAMKPGLNILALLILIRLWYPEFQSHKHMRWFPMVLVLGYSGVVYLDLVARKFSIYKLLGFSLLSSTHVWGYSPVLLTALLWRMRGSLWNRVPLTLKPYE